MSRVKILDISNSKIIGRLLPFWARGRKVVNFLEAILSPLVTAHKVFREWAEDKYIASHITMQKPSMEWYLKYKFRGFLKDPEKEFYITHGSADVMACFSGKWNNDLPWDNDMLWDDMSEPVVTMSSLYSCTNTGEWDNDLYWDNNLFWENEPVDNQYEEFFDTIDEVNVFAPDINVTTTYTEEDYKNDIRSIMSLYATSYKNINVFIVKPE